MTSTSGVSAQVTTQDVAGLYVRKLVNTTDHIIIYTLNLNADDTFDFHSYYKIQVVTSEYSHFNE